MGTPETKNSVGRMSTGVSPHMCSEEHLAGMSDRRRPVARASILSMRPCSSVEVGARTVRSIRIGQDDMADVVALDIADDRVNDDVEKKASE
ncbi:hypothetical protein HPB52_011733 [Rhipicephalus sanguineus]|uniref:Uncharacterized protein n=1 Tax=Rhipicephalus sanguineus TaxID=34632 RepID=A0A9D4QE78_RHISA|nr:hypothetical protein HPB52_011733 [Rhipicephalus sanguineus]